MCTLDARSLTNQSTTTSARAAAGRRSPSIIFLSSFHRARGPKMTRTVAEQLPQPFTSSEPILTAGTEFTPKLALHSRTLLCCRTKTYQATTTQRRTNRQANPCRASVAIATGSTAHRGGGIHSTRARSYRHPALPPRARASASRRGPASRAEEDGAPERDRDVALETFRVGCQCRCVTRDIAETRIAARYQHANDTASARPKQSDPSAPPPWQFPRFGLRAKSPRRCSALLPRAYKSAGRQLKPAHKLS